MAATPVSSALFAFLGLDTKIEPVERKVSIFMEKITFLILFQVLQRAASHARIAHRAKINVFDVLRALLSVHYSPRELKLFLAWCRIQDRKNSVIMVQAPGHQHKFSQERELKLEFCPIPALPHDLHRRVTSTTTPTSLSNISGCQFYPPIPPAFTFKFTPVLLLQDEIIQFFNLKFNVDLWET
jgi:hypothetical protein